jgi:hypothetical protein
VAPLLSGHKNTYKELLVGDSPYTIPDGGPDYFLLNTTGGDITVNLPTNADNKGRVLHFLKTSASNVATLDGEGAELIEGAITLKMHRHRRAVGITPRSSGTTEWTTLYGGIKLSSHPVDLSIPKRPAANPPNEGTEDGFPTLDFDDTTDESVFLMWQLSKEYFTAGRVIVQIFWFVDVAPGAEKYVTWGLEYKKLEVGEAFDFSAGTTTVYDQELVDPATNKKMHMTTFSLTTTGWETTDGLLIRFFRDADGTGGTDDFVGDARMFYITISEDKVSVNNQ